MKQNKEKVGAKLPGLRIAIVGMGLMGGSLAIALKGAVNRVVGVDHNMNSLRLAAESGIVDAVASRFDEGISEVDLVILAVPVRQIVSLVEAMKHLRPDGCMLLDVGSTKRDIEVAMVGLPENFGAIGGHPMCGKEFSGISAATGDLFDGETFILCRNQRTNPLVEDVALELVERIGSRPLFMAAETHDKLVAASSHLPYVVAATLMGRAWIEARVDDRLWQVSASGLRDTTRLASSDPDMMLEIMMTNDRSLREQIEAFSEELAIISESLRRHDWDSLRILLHSAQQRRDEFLRRKVSGETNSS